MIADKLESRVDSAASHLLGSCPGLKEDSSHDLLLSISVSSVSAVIVVIEGARPFVVIDRPCGTVKVTLSLLLSSSSSQLLLHLGRTLLGSLLFRLGVDNAEGDSCRYELPGDIIRMTLPAALRSIVDMDFGGASSITSSFSFASLINTCSRLVRLTPYDSTPKM